MKLFAICLLCLGSVSAASAAIYSGNQTFSAPFTSNDSVNLVGNLTLNGPGTYTATAWNIVGNVTFASAGTYTLRATTGALTITGNVYGPATGVVTVHFDYKTTMAFIGTAAANVVPIDDTSETVAPPTPGIASSAPLMNISARGILRAGESLTAGFVIGGTASRRVLVRAVGPTLAAFGVSAVMANPMLSVVRIHDNAMVGVNDDWGGAAAIASVFTGVGAFPLPSASRDAALALTLPPGAYTVEARGASSTDAGAVLVEVYFID